MWRGEGKGERKTYAGVIGAVRARMSGIISRGCGTGCCAFAGVERARGIFHADIRIWGVDCAVEVDGPIVCRLRGWGVGFGVACSFCENLSC